MRRVDHAAISQQQQVLAVEPIHDLAELVVAEVVEERARCGSRVGGSASASAVASSQPSACSAAACGCPCGLLWESIRLRC